MELVLTRLQAHLRQGLIWSEQPAWPLLADWLAGRGMPFSWTQQKACQAQTDPAWQRLALASGWLFLSPDWGILTPAHNHLLTPAFGQLSAYIGASSQLQDSERQEELIRWWLRAWGVGLSGETLEQAQARWEVISSQEAARLSVEIQLRRQRARAIQAALQRSKALQDE
jgi:hypothetical protein